jgi:transposase
LLSTLAEAALAVLPAHYQERDVIAVLLKTATARLPSIGRAVATADVKAEAGIPPEIVKRSDQASRFDLLPQRWIRAGAGTSRTCGWLGRCRRLATDFANRSRTHAAFVILAMIRIMLRRLVRR